MIELNFCNYFLLPFYGRSHCYPRRHCRLHLHLTMELLIPYIFYFSNQWMICKRLYAFDSYVHASKFTILFVHFFFYRHRFLFKLMNWLCSNLRACSFVCHRKNQYSCIFVAHWMSHYKSGRNTNAFNALPTNCYCVMIDSVALYIIVKSHSHQRMQSRVSHLKPPEGVACLRNNASFISIPDQTSLYLSFSCQSGIKSVAVNYS